MLEELLMGSVSGFEESMIRMAAQAVAPARPAPASHLVDPSSLNHLVARLARGTDFSASRRFWNSERNSSK